MTEMIISDNQANATLPKILVTIIRLYLTIMVPILLTLASVRLVMTPLFLQIEYNRPGFPVDDYGFTTEDRLEYAPYAINYLLNNADISYLGDLTFPNERPLYTNSELGHMEDVKVVTRLAFMILLIGGIATAILIGYLLMQRTKQAKSIIRRSLQDGALLTLGIIGFIVLTAVIAWDLFFDSFHGLFFESGTWRFAYSDTLIRLFPEQLWFDVAILIGVLTVTGAIVMLLLVWRWGKTNIDNTST